VFVAIDDTDSPEGGCTTHLTYTLLSSLKEEYALVGYPRLVRLNPTVPWKTRGNGATIFFLAKKGGGKSFSVGERDGEEITAWERGEGRVDPEELLEVVREALEEEGRRWRENSPGCVVGEVQPPEELYFKGVRGIVKREVAEGYLTDAGALWWGGRGVIGAACASAWRGMGHTYEILAYRKEEMWGRERAVREDEVKELERLFPSTFNNYDPLNRHICIRPSTPCPVLIGVRGTNPEELKDAYGHLTLEDHPGYLIYLTNQGSDHHLIPLQGAEPAPGGSYLLPATIAGHPRRERGGHAFVTARGEGGFEITLAAYRQTGELRDILMQLLPGDRVVAAGSVDSYPGTLNLEKIGVVEAPPVKEKIANPLCPGCGRRMKSSGKEGFRCPRCGRRAGKDAAEYRVVERRHLEGLYEAAVSARRHLSRPLKLMGDEERRHFLEGRLLP